MNAYNPLSTLSKLEAAGFNRGQAEALANELRESIQGVVTHEQLKAEIDRLFIRQSAAIAAMLALVVTLLKVFA